MLGIKFIKSPPTTYLLQYSKGKLIREGIGLAFFYYSPTTSLISVPIGSSDAPFIFKEVTADFQDVTVQGQVTFRIADAKRVSQLINFTLDSSGKSYVSEDPNKLPMRVVNAINVLTRKELQGLPLRDAIRASDTIVQNVRKNLSESPEITSLGLEILGLSILAIKPSPETARALEAEAREKLLGQADEAIYTRRNAAVEKERAIKENELNTEIAVEMKKRQIREAQMDADRSIQTKRHQMETADMDAQVGLEGKKKQFVAISVENSKAEADARAYGISTSMQALSNVDAKTLQALASVGMKPDQLIAIAFQEIAEKAEKIGQLNISPD
ncbi:MAG: band 7 protein, partial [Verrucomicrobiales bacterium]|nr:band 7 protein [Verrucomicrobiales bacterium]